MFQKPTFGNNATTGFGSFNTGATTATPFGGFKPTTGTFGAGTTTQPTTGGGLFSANTSGGLFGSSAPTTSTSAFGANTSGFGFGSTAPSTGLFGSNTSGGLFGNTQNTSAFGAKPAGFGFGSTTTTGTTSGGLFGSTAATGTGLFGQQNNTMSGGGLFGGNTAAGGFGQQQQQPTGTAHVKYNPVVGTDVVVKSGISQNINIKHHCITFMKEYENKSLEELRLEDYMAGRKGSTTGVFGGFQPQTENKPLFGATGFGQTATTSAPSMFGGGAIGTSTFPQTSTFSFSGANQNTTNTTGLFGANKPAFGAAPTTNTLFGATTTQAPTFGTTTPSFGFGSNTQNQSRLLFGAKPATTGFGAAPASTGFGAFNTGGGGIFDAKTTTAPAFGTTAPAFGTMTGGFGTNTSTTTGLFGSNTFGKPATTQPFGFNTQPTGGLGTGLGSGLGANTFQAKPAAPGFGTLGSNTMFQQPANTTFKTGLEGGLGGGMFNNPSTLGGSAFGLGNMNANNSLLNNNMTGASATGNVHEQMLNLAARPYGDSPLFKDLLPDSTTSTEEVLKPTNPTALKAVLERSQSGSYRLTPPTSSGSKLRLQPRTGPAHDRKSLFDGLEESDASLEDKLCLKPSRKRLVLKPHHTNSNDSSRGGDITLDTTANNNNTTERNHEENSSVLRATGDVIAASNQVGNTRDESLDKYSRKEDDRPMRREGYKLDQSSSERSDIWLQSPSSPWNEKENPVGWESTPRLYPNLDKEKSSEFSERRASWLTTRPLRQPLVSSGNPDAADNTVRELGIKPGATISRDKENVHLHSVSEDNFVPPRDMPPHPTGVRLTRPGYYTIPTLDEMIGYMRPDGKCILPHLTIGRRGFGNVYFDYEINVAGLDLDDIVHFLHKEIIVYPEETDKPAVGEGLNRPATVTLDRIWPRDKTDRSPITDPDRLAKMDYEGKLKRICEKHLTKFIEYRPQTGSWVFRVEHFSKYGLTDSDEEDEHTPDVLKRQLTGQSMQKSAPPAAVSSAAVSSPGLGGLGPSEVPLAESDIYSMSQTSLNLLNGTNKAYEMDTTEDNAESQSLYQENTPYGVKSPTSELARLENRQSHNVQLMKASLYTDADMEEDMSLSTGDQLVPGSAPALSIVSSSLSQRLPKEIRHEEFVSPGLDDDEVKMRPLIVRPHTIVLKYHRKVPPFKKTIAGRLDAACIADMSISRARHSRVGFGPSSALVYATSYDSITDLPKRADHSNLDSYVSGRQPDDWSEQTVARIALGQPDNTYNIQEVLGPHLATLLQWSQRHPAGEGLCPRLSLRPEPSARLSALKEHLKHASKQLHRVKFGVSGSYCYEVWQLCEVLWGADLENDGMPGTDDLSIVNRHKKLLEWFKRAVDSVTEIELSKPRKGEKEDESDGHSYRVWTLLLGGRVVEACKLARDHGDLNMAMLIAQAAGEPWFRSLVSRQLAQWRECGADALIASHRLAVLQLVAGAAPLPDLSSLDWLRTLHATARYLCPQVPTLERVIRTYEGFFKPSSAAEEEIDLTLQDDETVMQLPLPEYSNEYTFTVIKNGKERNVLDLRYELLRARAFNTRPKLRPEAYTPDTMDYTLCFLLGTWFGNPTVASIVGVAEQLEASGAWHLAIQALAHHPNDTARGHLIRGVLSRHAPAKAETSELKNRLGLIRELGVPEKWILLAQAHRAKYEHLPTLEAEYLVGAEEWNAAHRVLLEDIFADVVLADDLQSIAPLLEKLNEAAKRHEVSGWETGGQALYHYIHICEEIRGLVSEWSGRAAVVSRLEALRPALAAAARALPALPHRSPATSCARSEMGARLVQLALAAGESAHMLAELLGALRLPPDCTPHAHHKITTDLAERASEMCVESASSSPLSSHHRATVTG